MDVNPLYINEKHFENKKGRFGLGPKFTYRKHIN
jgi:hypothetical protein